MDAGSSQVGPARLATLERGSKLLVMDRLTGLSVYVPEARGQALRLLGTREERLPAALVVMRRELMTELAVYGVGGAGLPRPQTLNTLILKLTNACNYACAYCYDYESEESATTLELSLALRALEESLELCDEGLQVIFHGGEPFLAFDHVKQVVLAGERLSARLGKQLIFTGQTNLSRLTPEAVEFSVEHQISWGFSLDGPARRNDVFRVLRSGAGTH